MFVGCRQALKWLRTKYRVASADTAASVVQAAATGVVDASYSADSDTARMGAIPVPGSDDTDSPAVQVPARARTVEEIVSVVVEEKGWLDKVPTYNRSFDNAVSVIAVVSPWSLRRRRPCSLAVIIVQVASCASNGVALLIEGVTDELPAALDALVSRRMHKVGRQLQVTIGDRSIVLHPDFKMYLQVRQTSCVFPPCCIAAPSACVAMFTAQTAAIPPVLGAGAAAVPTRPHLPPSPPPPPLSPL